MTIDLHGWTYDEVSKDVDFFPKRYELERQEEEV